MGAWVSAWARAGAADSHDPPPRPPPHHYPRSPPPGTPNRKIRNSIKLSEKGSVIGIISTEVCEDVKGMPDMVVGGGSHSGGFDRLVINSNSDGRVGGDDVGGGVESSSPSMVANGRNVVVHGGAKGAGLGAR
jgi:hypothetical protein